MIVAAVAYGLSWVPGMAVLTDGIEAAGLRYGFGFALMNLAWAPGQFIGAAAGGVLVGVAGDAVPYLLLASLCLGTVVGLHLASRRFPAAESA